MIRELNEANDVKEKVFSKIKNFDTAQCSNFHSYFIDEIEKLIYRILYNEQSKLGIESGDTIYSVEFDDAIENLSLWMLKVLDNQYDNQYGD